MFHFKTNLFAGPEVDTQQQYRPSRNSARMDPSSQRRGGSSSMHHTAVSPSLYGIGASKKNRIFRSKTSDWENKEATMNIQRTGSGGLFMKNRLRAAEMSALYELSDDKDTSLNRTPVLRQKARYAPSMGGHMMTAQQAIQNYDKQEQKHLAKKDPLLTAHELKERQRSKEAMLVKKQRKQTATPKLNNNTATAITPCSRFEMNGHSSTTQRGGVGGGSSSPRGVMSYEDDAHLPDAVGFEIAQGGVVSMVAPVGATCGHLMKTKLRAAELSDMYELSDDKDTSLNRTPVIKQITTYAPSMGGHRMTAQQAIQNYDKQEQKHLAKKDPLLTAHELKERQRSKEAMLLKKQRKQTAIPRRSSNTATAITPCSGFEKNGRSTKQRGGVGGESSSPRRVMSYEDDVHLPDAVGFEIVQCGIVAMVAPAVAAKSFPARTCGYRASNGVVYNVPNLC